MFIKCQAKFKQKLFLSPRRILRSNTVAVSDMRTILEGESDGQNVFVMIGVGVETQVEKRL